MADASGVHSISRFIAQLNQGDRKAAKSNWLHSVCRVAGLASGRLRDLPGREVVAEDIALGVFDRFYRRTGKDHVACLAWGRGIIPP